MMIEVKICENCKNRNPVNAVECEQCGYDLTFVFPQKVDDAIQKNEENHSELSLGMVEEQVISGSNWELVSISNETNSHELGVEISVGRDCDVFNEQFNSSNYTSRTHAKLRVKDDTVQVMDASTNGTFVDEKRIPKMEWITVNDGSSIRFADISFRIRRRKNAD